MVTLVLHPDPQQLPIGTAVKVYELPANAPAGYVPSGAAMSEPTVEAGSGGGSSTLTVTGLAAGKRYVGVVSGAVKIGFSVEEATGGAGVTSWNGKEGAVVATAADVEAVGLESPAFTGNPTAPTQAAGNSSTRLASTAFVQTAKAEAATAAAGKDATLKGEAETKDVAAIAAAEAGAKTAGDAAYRKQSVAIPMRERETVSVPGTITTGKLIPMGIVSLGSGETQKAVKVSVKVQVGTKVTGKLRRKNGAGAIEDITGFTGIEATTTISSKTPTAVSLADGDELYFLPESVEGTPEGLAVCLYVDHVV